MKTEQLLGNKTLLELKKTAFLCSQKIPASAVLKCYDWAIEQRKAGNCVVCGNHSTIEKDVFEILLKGKQPLILMLARGMKSRWEPVIEQAIKENRLLVISPMDKKVKRVTRATAETQNRETISISDHICVGYVTPQGQLDNLLKNEKFELL
ncbi:MAG: DNA-binding protein [Bacteroidetes bacterium CG_4_9_14_3_um_filter_41_19]|nr:MAG: DNA-binding protein [Bacteroidetes bacterium CG_4_9_14_3_um_filter_41_19]